MATITLVNRVWYKNGNSGASYVVGYEENSNRVVRYTMTAPSTGASKVSLEFQGNNLADGSYPSLRFYIGTSSTSHANAGAGSTYTGSLTRQSDNTTYKGSANIVLMPNKTYYVWVFPANTTYGWCYWSATTGHAVATTSGGAYSTMEIDTPRILGEAFDIAVTRYDDSFTHTVTYRCGDASGTICTKSSTIPISCTLPLSLASQAPNSTNVLVTVSLTTYNGDTAIGTVGETINCIIPSEDVKPTFTVDFTDAMGYKNTYGDFIQGRSKVHFKVNATGSYGSTIKTYSVTCNDETFTEAEGTTGVITAAGYIPCRVSVVDSRNRTVNETFYVLVEMYSPPQITALSVKRCSDMNGTENDQGGYIQVKTSGSITSLDGQNSSKFQLWYKKSADPSYTKVTLSTAYSITNHTHSFAADTGSSYDVMIVATDDFTADDPITRETSASTGFTLMHWKANGKGMAIGKVTEEDRFEVGMDMHCYGDLSLENALPVTEGGTGATTAEGARDNLGAAAADHKHTGYTEVAITASNSIGAVSGLVKYHEPTGMAILAARFRIGTAMTQQIYQVGSIATAKPGIATALSAFANGNSSVPSESSGRGNGITSITAYINNSGVIFIDLGEDLPANSYLWLSGVWFA